jgi:hypothetical protein
MGERRDYLGGRALPVDVLTIKTRPQELLALVDERGHRPTVPRMWSVCLRFVLCAPVGIRTPNLLIRNLGGVVSGRRDRFRYTRRAVIRQLLRLVLSRAVPSALPSSGVVAGRAGRGQPVQMTSIGAATMRSPNGALVGPVCSMTPPANRLPRRSRGSLSHLASRPLTEEVALTSMPAIRPSSVSRIRSTSAPP